MRSCQHGFNSACLICGFSQIEGNRVWFDWAFKNQQSKVDELQEEFAEDERFLKEKIDQKEQQIVELKYLQSMDKEFIHTLNNKSDELQKRVDSSLMAFENLKDEINELHGQCDLHLIKYLEEKAQVLEQALKGGESNG